MSKLETVHENLLASIGSREAQLGKAQRGYKANRKRAYVAHNKQKRAQRLADKYGNFGPNESQRKAEHYIREGRRFGVVAYNNHLRAQEELGKVKRLTQKLHELEIRNDEVEKRLAKVTIKGNRAVGGTPWDRWMAVTLASVANCASGKRRNFYSMAGGWDVDHVIVPGEAYGERSDCSSTVYGWIKAAGLPDPQGGNFAGGFTGTLAYPHADSGWKQVSLDKFLNTDAPGYIIYGEGNGHHTEAKCPSDTDKYRTAGHGSAPVDFGTTFLFGSNEYQRYYLYLP